MYFYSVFSIKENADHRAKISDATQKNQKFRKMQKLLYQSLNTSDREYLSF